MCLLLMYTHNTYSHHTLSRNLKRERISRYTIDNYNFLHELELKREKLKASIQINNTTSNDNDDTDDDTIKTYNANIDLIINNNEHFTVPSNKINKSINGLKNTSANKQKGIRHSKIITAAAPLTRENVATLSSNKPKLALLSSISSASLSVAASSSPALSSSASTLSSLSSSSSSSLPSYDAIHNIITEVTNDAGAITTFNHSNVIVGAVSDTSIKKSSKSHIRHKNYMRALNALLNHGEQLAYILKVLQEKTAIDMLHRKGGY